MLKPIVFANSFTVIGLGAYVVCRVLTLIAPDLLFNIGQSWFHTLSLGFVKTVIPMDIGTFLYGAVTLGIFVWIMSYAFAKIYNSFSR